MTRKQNAERQTAIESLRKIIKPGDTVYTILDHVSRSGMSRNIRVVVPYTDDDGAVGHWHPNYNVGLAIDARRAKNGDGLVMGGCGMDMGFSLVSNLSAVLYPEYKCLGKGRARRRRCPSNYHSNYRSETTCSCEHWHECPVCHIVPYNTGVVGAGPRYVCRTHRSGWVGTNVANGADKCKHAGEGAFVPLLDCAECHGTGTITHAPQSWRKLHRDGYALSHQWM